MLIAKNEFISHVSYNYRLLSYDLGLADHITHNKTIPSNSSLHTPGDMPFTFTDTWCHYNSFLHIPGDILFTFTVYTHLHGDFFLPLHIPVVIKVSHLYTHLRHFIHFYTHLGTFHSPLHIPYAITFTYTWCLYIHL